MNFPRFRELLPAASSAILLGLLCACIGREETTTVAPPPPEPETFADGKPAPPAWTKNLSIYEVNVRQYSEAGTFAALEADLPRLRDLGFGILWLMPIHPIGEEGRKGSLGSYYAVQDYKGINPDYGTAEDFRSLVDKTHELGMYLIIDWVANHTAWDNAWTVDHPAWYTKDSVTGGFVPPVADWSDVIDLDFSKGRMRAALTDAMAYWVREFDIDGFRCDVAGMVPVEFWDSARAVLDGIKPVFMLAEAEEPPLQHHAFDMSYGWHLHHVMNRVARGEEAASTIDSVLHRYRSEFDPRHYMMLFTSNHDENSWNGTVFERMRDNHRNMAVLSFTLPGMPLVYSGQEAPMRKRLEFFEKDPIDWGDYAFADFYRTMVRLKRETPALWNGQHGGAFARWDAGADSVYAYTRGEGPGQVLVLLNLGSEVARCQAPTGSWNEVFGQPVTIDALAEVLVGGNGFRLFVRN